MAKAKEPINPFYLVVVLVGVVFVVTAFAYGLMSWRATQPLRQTERATQPAGREPHPLLVFLDRHGIALLSAELVVLGVATAAAMALDQRRSRVSARQASDRTSRRMLSSGGKSARIPVDVSPGCEAATNGRQTMKVNHVEQVTQAPVTMEGSHGCQVRWLVDEQGGAPNFAMREFEVAPGGFTPRHSHPYEHEVFVLEGSGEVLEGDVAHPLAAGDFVLVSPDEVHQFRNTGDAPLKFLCMVPNSSARMPIKMAPECGRPQVS